MTTAHNYMIQALELAKRGRYTVSPNPMVGCLIVKDDEIVGRGYHQKAGEAHAEVFALREAGEQAKGATAYVTLEPCCHHGRTPPCTLALIQAGINKVVLAGQDPNPLVAGKGIAELKAAGIEIELDVCHAEARELNKIFFHYIQTQRPYVIAKWAMSLDGKTITAADDSKQISNIDAQHDAHDLRRQVDAILVGAQTARDDDPQLTARLADASIDKQPLRIVLSHSGKLSPELKLFSNELPGKTLLAVTDAAMAKKWQCTGVETLVHHDLTDLLQQLGERNITSLLVEGGENIRQQFFAANLINEIIIYVAPVIIGDLEKKLPLNNISYQPMGTNIKIRGFI
jgi:diaminohydroxyphosphoribosylaminopyrimidine deaminase/5-amino-6-(5-phosphoribosylamino)uracil reductase